MCADILKPRLTNGQETTGQLQVTTAQDTSLQKSSGENAKTHGLSRYANMHVSFCPV